jgi:tubulin--tyrosine ligase
VKSTKDALKYIDSQKQKTPWIVQRYIDSPFLIKQRKFDIRSWVLVTSDFCIYLYREGVLRTSSEEFNLKDISDPLVHLTNHCVQINGPNYSAFESGNEMWYSQFQAYLDSLEGPHRSFEKDVLPYLRTMVVDVLLAIHTSFEAQANSTSNTRAFQFFGFDFMLDDTFQLWLLEVNGAPAIAADLADAMVADIISLAVDPIFQGSDASTAATQFELLYPHHSGQAAVQRAVPI